MNDFKTPRHKWSDYVGQTVHARFAVEYNVDGCDVPVIRDRINRPRHAAIRRAVPEGSTSKVL